MLYNYSDLKTVFFMLYKEARVNNLSGTILDDGVWKHDELGDSLELSFNRVSGPIPDTLGKLQELRELYVFALLSPLDLQISLV